MLAGVRVVAAYNCIPMSQVTRCPSCGTRFKVVADQLRISQGWVRCGMCQGVFDASQDLQSVPDELLQAEAADQQPVQVEVPPSSESESSVSEPSVSESVQPRVEESWAAHSSVAEGLGAESAGAGFESKSESLLVVEAAEVSAAVDDLREERGAAALTIESSFVDHAKPLLADEIEATQHDPVLEAIPARDKESFETEQGLQAQPQPVEPVLEPEAEPIESAEQLEQVSAEALLSTDGGAPLQTPAKLQADADVGADSGEEADVASDKSESPAVDEPGFVRQARRKAFWHSAGMRVVLVLGSLAAVAGVAGQYAWQQRDTLAAQYPELAPALEQACHWAGCELQARREIADVVISGSGFKQLADAHQYQWSLTLENRSDVTVATPMAELTLTDAQDKPLLRRVIDLKPLGAPPHLQAREEWSVNVPVQVQDLGAAVAGYRALVFYP